MPIQKELLSNWRDGCGVVLRHSQQEDWNQRRKQCHIGISMKWMVTYDNWTFGVLLHCQYMQCSWIEKSTHNDQICCYYFSGGKGHVDMSSLRAYFGQGIKCIAWDLEAEEGGKITCAFSTVALDDPPKSPMRPLHLILPATDCMIR